MDGALNELNGRGEGLVVLACYEEKKRRRRLILEN